jgi:hypothetical protein
MNRVTLRLHMQPGDFLKAKMEAIIPSFAAMTVKQKRYGAQFVLTRLPISHYIADFSMTVRPGEPGDVAPAWVTAEMEIHDYSSLQITSSAGALYAGSIIESLPGGETKASLVVDEFLAAGEPVTITDADDNILFAGKVIRANYDAENAQWVLSATDDLSESGLDEEMEMAAYPDVVDALPPGIDDLSRPTRFPTVPVAGVTLREWISTIEALRGARLFYDPSTERYILSDKPRVWTVTDPLSFSESIDASQYFNVVIIEQDDAWEQDATRKTSTSEYGEYRLVTDRAGEKLYSARLTGPAGVVVQDSFEYNNLNQVIKAVSIKGTKTTTTTYTIQQGDNPFIRSEVAVTIDSTGETAFSERRQTTVSLLRNDDGTMLVLTKETREWFEQEQVIEYE